MIARLLGVAALSAATVAIAGWMDKAEAAKKLAGAWVVEKATDNGEANEAVVGAVFEFKDGALTARPKDPKIEPKRSAYEVRGPVTDGKPDRITLRRLTPAGGKPPVGPDRRPGIFRVSGDTLELCYCTADIDEKQGDGPTDFESKPGLGHIHLTLKRKQ